MILTVHLIILTSLQRIRRTKAVVIIKMHIYIGRTYIKVGAFSDGINSTEVIDGDIQPAARDVRGESFSESC